jgi:hypothetical protein
LVLIYKQGLSQQGKFVEEKVSHKGHSAVNKFNGPNVKRQRLNGIVPVIWGLPNSVSLLMFEKLAYWLGMLPLKSLSLMNSSRTFGPSIASWVGSVPVHPDSVIEKLDKF